jgi:epidermal growth factor receptor substrate 15
MFEIYYLSLDPTGKGQVSALDAAKFLKRSGLSDTILSKVCFQSRLKPTGFS